MVSVDYILAVPLCSPRHSADRNTFAFQSANQPRLSYGEMAEDYPRYPDIHDLDLTLLNPRMIVVREADQELVSVL